MCVSSAVGGIGDTISDKATETSGKIAEKGDKVSDWANDKKPEEPIADTVFDRVVEAGNNLLFNAEKTYEHKQKEKVRQKNKKQMDNIRDKYQPPAKKSVPKKPDEVANSRKDYADLKARLGNKPS